LAIEIPNFYLVLDRPLYGEFNCNPFILLLNPEKNFPSSIDEYIDTNIALEYGRINLAYKS
jgi:hypothetical protein